MDQWTLFHDVPWKVYSNWSGSELPGLHVIQVKIPSTNISLLHWDTNTNRIYIMQSNEGIVGLLTAIARRRDCFLL